MWQGKGGPRVGSVREGEKARVWLGFQLWKCIILCCSGQPAVGGRD